MRITPNIITADARTVEFGPIPRKGLDPVVGLSRSACYALEKLGLIRLIRLRKSGNIRGRVLIDYVSVRRYYDRLSREQSRIRPPADNQAQEALQGADAS